MLKKMCRVFCWFFILHGASLFPFIIKLLLQFLWIINITSTQACCRFLDNCGYRLSFSIGYLSFLCASLFRFFRPFLLSFIYIYINIYIYYLRASLLFFLKKIAVFVLLVTLLIVPARKPVAVFFRKLLLPFFLDYKYYLRASLPFCFK